MYGTPIKDAAQLVNLPPKVLYRLQREGVIGDLVSDADLRGLAIISSIWRSEWFLRAALADFSHSRRMDLILKPELTRAERYMLTCYLNTPKGQRIQTREIIGRVEHYLGASVTLKQVKRIRSMAYDIRRCKRLAPDST